MPRASRQIETHRERPAQRPHIQYEKEKGKTGDYLEERLGTNHVQRKATSKYLRVQIVELHSPSVKIPSKKS